LISSNRSKLSFRKDECSVFFFLNISNRSALSILALHKIDPGLELVHRVQYHLAGVVRLVVCDLDFFKTDDLFLELLSGVGSVWVTVEAVGGSRVSLASHQPGRAVVGIPIPLIITRHYVQKDEVLDTRLGVKI